MWRVWRAKRDSWESIARMSLNQVDLMCLMLDAEDDAQRRADERARKRRDKP